ncbi:peptide ABC transporter permease [Spirochaetia bacterium]|nr:peptide ABC transporter permease [Spirochaetia bacterium]
MTINKRIEKTIDGLDDLFKIAENRLGSAEQTGYSNYSYWNSTLRMFRRNKGAMLWLYLLVILAGFTFIQPLLPYQKDPTYCYINEETGRQERNLKPSGEFWFGTNSIGQDLWSRIWSGARTSLFIGLTVGLVDVIVGLTIGSLWGYVRFLDGFITEFYNVLHNIPSSIVLILVSYILRPSIPTIIAAMCVTSWLPMARFIRNQIVIIRDREFNLASRCLGTPTGRIITKNLLPQLVSVIVMRVALSIPQAIGNEVFLTYIGLGLPISQPSLGNLVNEGRMVMMSPALRYQLIFPSIVLSLVTIAFYVMGNAFADAADPRTHT